MERSSAADVPNCHHDPRCQQLLARVDQLVIATIAVGRSGGVQRRVVLRGEAEVCDRGWSLGIPDSGIGLCNEGPDVLQAVLDRLDLVGQVSEYDELVWDYAARCISSPQRIGEAQRDLPGGAMTCRRLVLEIREAPFIGRKRVGQPSFEEEPEPPGASSSGPDEPLRQLLDRDALLAPDEQSVRLALVQVQLELRQRRRQVVVVLAGLLVDLPESATRPS